jgi:hypothetical protein
MIRCYRCTDRLVAQGEGFEITSESGRIGSGGFGDAANRTLTECTRVEREVERDALPSVDLQVEDCRRAEEEEDAVVVDGGRQERVPLVGGGETGRRYG